MTISGLNFNSNDLTTTASLELSVAYNTFSWTSGTTVTCAAASYRGGSTQVGMTVSGVIGTGAGSFGQAIFTFDSPVVTQHMVPNVVLTGGNTMTLTGFNFGFHQPSATVSLGTWDDANSANCATASWQAATTILCRTPGTSFVVGIDRWVTVTAASIVGTSSERFTYDGPGLTQLTPQNGAASGATSVSISGLNFGFADQTASGSLLTSGVDLYTLTTTWSSASSVSVSQPAVAAGTLRSSGVVLRLIVNAIVGTGTTNPVTFDAPVVSFVQPSRNNIPASGYGRLTVSGLNFASADTTTTIFLGVTVCTTASWSSATILKCFTPAGTGGNLRFTVAVLSIVGTAFNVPVLSFTFDTPVISESFLTANSATTVGSVLTMLGMNFGVLDTTVSAVLGATMCTSAAWTGATSVACRPSIGGTGSQTLGVVVTANVGTSRRAFNLINLFTFDAPVATNAAAVNGAASGFTPLTLSGINFGYGPDATATAALVGTGSVQGDVFATSALCGCTSWASVTALLCTPSLAVSPMSIPLNHVLTVSGIVGTAATLPFSFDGAQRFAGRTRRK